MVDRYMQHKRIQAHPVGPDTPLIGPQAQGVGGYTGRPGDVVVNKKFDPGLSSQTMFDRANAFAKGQNVGYDPYMTQNGPEFQTMDYDPYQNAAVNASDAGASQQYVNQQAQLSQTGGMTTADRIRSINDFNRQKILGRLGAGDKFGQAASQNKFDVGKMNMNRGQNVEMANVGTRNQASSDLLNSRLRQSTNLYKAGLDERDLQRQLAASKIISDSQADDGGPSYFNKAIKHWGEEIDKMW